MARIKSAWEIALEKTENLNVDLEKINKDKAVKLGRRICGLYINDIDFTIEKFKKEYENAENKEQVNEGIVNNLLLNLALPVDNTYNNTLDKLVDIIEILKKDPSELIDLINQIRSFFDQYLNHQTELVNQMKEQFGPVLQQKEAQLKQQYGPDFTYAPENDQEFMKLLDDNLKKLDEQYEQTLIQVKEKIKEELL
jgi:recombinational DNA repair ATPase RecF